MNDHTLDKKVFLYLCILPIVFVCFICYTIDTVKDMEVVKMLVFLFYAFLGACFFGAASILYWIMTKFSERKRNKIMRKFGF